MQGFDKGVKLTVRAAEAGRQASAAEEGAWRVLLAAFAMEAHLSPPQPPTANCQVREAISILDLDVMVYPTPKGGVTWRPKAVELGGKAQVSSAECMGAT